MRNIVDDKSRRVDIDEEGENRAFRTKADVICDPVENCMFSGFGEGY